MVDAHKIKMFKSHLLQKLIGQLLIMTFILPMEALTALVFLPSRQDIVVLKGALMEEQALQVGGVQHRDLKVQDWQVTMKFQNGVHTKVLLIPIKTVVVLLD